MFRIRTVTPVEVKRYDKMGCAEKEEIKRRISNGKDLALQKQNPVDFAACET